MINYFDLPEVSSSDLGALKRTFYGLPDNRGELIEIFNFGNLVDAMLTERHLLHPALMGLRQGSRHDEDFVIIYFDAVTWRLAERLAKTLAADPVIKLLLPRSIGQYIVRRTLDFLYDDGAHKIKGKCKFDLLCKPMATSLDFKTTSCTTYKQFVESIFFFDYDKQGAWYMDLGRIDYHWIAGISKKTGKVFKYAIERGDQAHKSGVDKYSVWAYRWNMLVEPFARVTQENYIARTNGVQYNQIFINEALNLRQ